MVMHMEKQRWGRFILKYQDKSEPNEKEEARDFPGGAVVKNPPANLGDTGSSPGPGRSHMLWSN